MQCQFVHFDYIFVWEINDFRKLEKERKIYFIVDASKQLHIKATATAQWGKILYEIEWQFFYRFLKMFEKIHVQ